MAPTRIDEWEKSALCPNISATHHNLVALALRRASLEISNAISSKEFMGMPDQTLKTICQLDFTSKDTLRVFGAYPELSLFLAHCAYQRGEAILAFKIKRDALNNEFPINSLTAFKSALSLTSDEFISLNFATYFEEPRQKSGLVKYRELVHEICHKPHVSENLRARVGYKYSWFENTSNMPLDEGSSIAFVDLPNWMTHLRTFISKQGGVERARDILSNQLSPEKVEIALDSALALNYDLVALERFLKKPLFIKPDKSIGEALSKTLRPLISEACKRGLFSLDLFDLYMNKAVEKNNLAYIAAFFQGDLPIQDRLDQIVDLLKKNNRHDLILEFFRYPRKNVDMSSYLDEVLAIAVTFEDYPVSFGQVVLDGASKVHKDRIFLALLRQEAIKEAKNFFAINYTEYSTPFEVSTLLPTLRWLPNQPIFLLVQEFGCDDAEILGKIANYELSTYGKSSSLEKLFTDYLQNENDEAFSAIFPIPEARSKLTDSQLSRALGEYRLNYKSEVAAELGLRRLARGEDKNSIASLVEKFADEDAECAHLMFLCTGESRWIEQVIESLDNSEIEDMRKRFSSSGVAPATELDDPDLHRDLFLEKESEATVKSRKPKASYDEVWSCRSRLAQGNSKSGTICEYHIVEPEITERQSNLLAGLVNEAKLRGDFQGFIGKEKGWYSKRVRERRQLYDWQERALDSWTEHGRVGIVEAVTGSGKTLVALHAIAEAIDDEFAVLVIVPARVLGDQWMGKTLDVFDRMGKLERIGNVTTNFRTPISTSAKSGIVTIAVLSGQLPLKIDRWLSSSNPNLKKMILIDEVHRISGKLYSSILKDDFTRRLGLTATLLPKDYDGTYLKNYFFGDSIYRYSFREARRDQVISPYQLFALGVEIPDSRLKLYQDAEFTLRKIREEVLNRVNQDISVSEFPDFAEGLHAEGKFVREIDQYFAAQSVIDSIVKESSESTSTRALQLTGQFIKKVGKTAVFSDFKINAGNCEAALEAVGIDARVITGETKTTEREEVLNELQSDSSPVKVVIAPKVLDEGVDIENLTIGLFAGMQRHRRSLIQRLGRVLRRHPTKKMAYVFIIYTVGTSDDPNIDGGKNSRFQLSQFDFIGENAEGDIESFVIGRDDQALRERLLEI